MIRQDPPWGDLISEVFEYRETGNVLLIGDFNAHTADLLEFTNDTY